jgi:hypothetical protein
MRLLEFIARTKDLDPYQTRLYLPSLEEVYRLEIEERDGYWEVTLHPEEKGW